MNKIIIAFVFALFTLQGCFEDEGNYEYSDLNSPTFTFSSSYPRVYGYLGQNMKCKGEFKYEQADSLALLDNSEYEWIIGDVVVSRERDLDMSTDTIKEMIGLEKLSSLSIPGFFAVKDKKLGLSYLQRIKFYVKPKFGKGSWFILSKDNGHSKLSYQRSYSVVNEDNEDVAMYENYDDIFKNMNEGKVLEGNPIKIVDHWAKHISSAVGSTTVLTDKEAYEVCNENLKIFSNIKDEFVGGVPENYGIVDVFHKSHYTSCLINKDGTIYMRQMSSNSLGGKYVNIPYAVDDKDSKFEFVSQADGSQTIRFIYDSANNRLVCFNSDKTITPVEKSEGEQLFDITDMGEGVKVWTICNGVKLPNTSFSSVYYNGGFIVYQKDGKNYLAEFVTKVSPNTFFTQNGATNVEIPIILNENSKLLAMQGYSWKIPYKFKYSFFYTQGNQLRYFDRATLLDHEFMTFSDDISAISFSTYTDTYYKQMAIGLTNGDFFLVDITGSTPEIIEESRFNVGGEVVDISLVGSKDAD